MTEGPPGAEGRREPARARRYFPALDGLRALAITGVVWHHSLPGPEPGWLGRGHVGVPLFFALSGYLITTLLLAERCATGDIALGAFWVRRSLRIFPLYYATLAGFGLALAVHEPNDATRHFAASLPFYASYTSNWFVDFDVRHPVWFAFAWSLATEEQFYLWWPTLLRHAERVGRWLAPLGLALVLGVDQLVELGALESSVPRISTLWRVLTSASAAMVLGAALAWASSRPRGFGWLARALAARHATSLAAAAVAVWIWQPFGPGVVLDIGFVVLVGAAAASHGRGFVDRLLAAPALVYVGRVSYGMYLFHVPVLGSLSRSFPGLVEHPPALFGATFALSVGVAALSHRYIESPLLALQERFRPARGPLPVAAEPPARARVGWVREG
ncbi:MAG TPA: acyltransferase [Polyangiaceae bacterium]|nr:acyltransferase [Polyangiaceae bacterium]